MELEYLFAGFAVFWAGIFVYLLWLQARLRSVSREVERLEERLADAEAEAEAEERAATGVATRSAEPPPADPARLGTFEGTREPQ